MLGTTGGASSTAKDSKLQLCKNVFLQEYKAWQQCELGLGLCPPSDQMLLMPKVAKAGTDQEMSCVGRFSKTRFLTLVALVIASKFLKSELIGAFLKVEILTYCQEHAQLQLFFYF